MVSGSPPYLQISPISNPASTGTVEVYTEVESGIGRIFLTGSSVGSVYYRAYYTDDEGTPRVETYATQSNFSGWDPAFMPFPASLLILWDENDRFSIGGTTAEFELTVDGGFVSRSRSLNVLM